MRVNSQEQIAFSTNRSKRNSTEIEKSLQKLSSGLKIAKGSHNASGLAISETVRMQVRGLAQAQRNMQDGLSLVESVNEGLNNISGLLQRSRELAVMNANGTLTDNDRESSEKELVQLLAAIDDTAGKMAFNTKKILGENGSLILQVGANPTQQITINLFDIGTTALGLEDATLVSQEKATELITKLGNAVQIVTNQLTNIGSDMESIEHHLRYVMLYETNLTHSLSLLEDTDTAKEMMNFISGDIRQKGDHLLVNHVNQNVQGVLSLFSK
ncbi:MAG TPA: flagellin [Sporosarcina psychrophila]|uniref:Flagellin n=1 Tax=Sporosarcina psychrophila TaxID=1476 RepID=A0A921G0W1_SPOPS|nr:flagellin [Sporosarcina psychrophila]